MTLKHKSFDESVIMQSFQQIAQEKGWIKPTVKTASKKLDLIPTKDLTQNLLKLCNGLREKGFEKYAEEIESKFMFYTQASKEKGEELIHDAHPKGSYKLQGVEGD